jgi:nucleotide-binding universal stress UspA family protein
MSELDELRPAAPDTYAVGVLPERYVVVVDESGPGPALSWALDHAARRSVPLLLAGPPGQFVFSRSYLEKIAADLMPRDLLIVGTRGDRDDATRSRAARLAGLAPCSTLIVPSGGIGGHGVLVAVGSPDTARPAARYGAAEAEARGEALTLLHVRVGDEPDPLPALAELLAHEYPRVEVRTEAGDAPVPTTVAERAETCSLLVVGSEWAPSAESTLGRIARSVGVPMAVAKPGVPVDEGE